MFLRLNKLSFSHNHHHNNRSMSQADVASLQAFRSLVSENINRVLESLKLGSEFLTLTWIHKCFEMLPMINSAFSKLMVEIDYPVTSWEAGSIDEYLDYTINLLEVLNLISSCLGHVHHACVSLTHALNLMESSPNLTVGRLRAMEITKHDSTKVLFKASRGHHEEISNPSGNGNGNGKERIFNEAMLVMKSIGFWVCGIVLSGLKSDTKPIMETMRNGLFMDSSLRPLDSILKKKFMEGDGIVKEVERVNESVRLIVLSGICKSEGGVELKTRLEVLGTGLKGLREAEEGLFGNVMAARNKVLETLRTRNNH